MKKGRSSLERSFFLFVSLNGSHRKQKDYLDDLGSPSVFVLNYQTKALVIITNKMKSTKIAAEEVPTPPIPQLIRINLQWIFGLCFEIAYDYFCGMFGRND